MPSAPIRRLPRHQAGGGPAWVLVVLACSVAILSCAAGLPQETVVHRVVDGDTIELADGRLLRYIGIDAPELRRRQGTRWVVQPDPFGRESAEANARLVAGKRVRLEYDVQTHDRYGRLLAYVYVDDRMVNATLLEEGYARLLTIPPDVRYVEHFRQLADEARRQQRGLWAGR